MSHKKYRTFKAYHQGQGLILPPYLDELIEKRHLVRVVNELVDQISDDVLCDRFEQEGTSPFHPRMMLKVIIYAYCQKIYSCRGIAKALREGIHFMWLSGYSRPSYSTINRFRSEYFKDLLEGVFTQVLDFLHERDYIQLETYFVDGSKLEANANKNTYVWKKNTQRYKERVRENVKKLFEEIEQINQQENLTYGDKDLEERGVDKSITSEEIKQVAETINRQIRDQRPKKVKQKLGRIARHLEKESERMKNYEQQESQFGERNSYSRTDPDATFMRMNGDQLKPAYNVVISTENQFITNYTVSRNAADSASFVNHVEKIEKRGSSYLPKKYVGDSGFGNEENYDKLDDLKIANYLKFNNFHYEQTKAFKENLFLKEHFLYDPQQDYYLCPQGRKLVLKEQKTIKTKTGYQSQVKIYQCEGCDGCPFKDKCTRSMKDRTIEVREKLEKYKNQARDNLTSEAGLQLRKQRNVDVEPVFADWKYNQGYRRLRLRGENKVNVEVGWLSISHNIRKINIKMNIAA